jgi:hypothetical protein
MSPTAAPLLILSPQNHVPESAECVHARDPSFLKLCTGTAFRVRDGITAQVRKSGKAHQCDQAPLSGTQGESAMQQILALMVCTMFATAISSGAFAQDSPAVPTANPVVD